MGIRVAAALAAMFAATSSVNAKEKIDVPENVAGGIRVERGVEILFPTTDGQYSDEHNVLESPSEGGFPIRALHRVKEANTIDTFGPVKVIAYHLGIEGKDEPKLVEKLETVPVDSDGQRARWFIPKQGIYLLFIVKNAD